MNQKRTILVIIIAIILGGWLLKEYKEYSKIQMMGNILNNIKFIDSITVKDGKTNEELLTLTSSEPNFSDMVKIYDPFYSDLKWSQRKLLRNEPFMIVEYFRNNELQYTLTIYEVAEKHLSLLPDDQTTIRKTHSFSYSPEGQETTYIFAIKEINQIVAVNDGLKELINKFH